MSAKPWASLSLDLDNQWAYMKTHGDAGWESYPSYFDVFVPYALERLERLKLSITVFVVGQDAAMPRHRDLLRSIVARGHELGNHSFHHEQWIHQFGKERIRSEIEQTARAIEDATGKRPVGYRGPGFSWSAELLEVLDEGGYLYDASTLPTYLGPLARAYYLRQSKISAEQMEQRKHLFGGFRDGRRPVKPYRWRLASGRTLLEIPVTTVPGIKTPFHLSYLLYLSRFSRALMSIYLRTALSLCRLTRTEPSFLLHPLDLLGGDQVPELAFFPGMDRGAAFKAEVFERVLRDLGRRFTLIPMSEHARRILERRPPVRAIA
jgi:peptidoglycan-N-acetylglucosamine deacetylase